MKKILFKLSAIALCAISPFSYAANTCLQNAQKHIYDHQLYLENCAITDEYVANLVDIANTNSITNLSLSNNQLTDVGIAQLTKIKNLSSIDLSNNQVGDDSLYALASTQIGYLSLAKANITHNGLQALAGNKKLVNLNIKDTKLDNASLKAIADNQNLVFLYLANNRITKNQTTIFANMTLYLLNLNNNPIGDQGIKSLADANINLFHCINCEAGDEAAIALANSHHQRTMLDLGSNKIGDKGAAALAQNAKATFISLENNQIGDEGAFAFANSHNPSLQMLIIDGNHISSAAITALKKRAKADGIFIQTQRDDENAKKRLMKKYMKKVK